MKNFTVRHDATQYDATDITPELIANNLFYKYHSAEFKVSVNMKDVELPGSHEVVVTLDLKFNNMGQSLWDSYTRIHSKDTVLPPGVEFEPVVSFSVYTQRSYAVVNESIIQYADAAIEAINNGKELVKYFEDCKDYVVELVQTIQAKRYEDQLKQEELDRIAEAEDEPIGRKEALRIVKDLHSKAKTGERGMYTVVARGNDGTVTTIQAAKANRWAHNVSFFLMRDSVRYWVRSSRADATKIIEHASKGKTLFHLLSS